MKRKIEISEINNIEEVEQAIISNPEWITEIEPTVTNVSLYYAGGGDVKVVSERTGKEYSFKQGKPTEVDPIDAEYFLTLKKVSGCCGSSNEVQLFGTS